MKFIGMGSWEWIHSGSMPAWLQTAQGSPVVIEFRNALDDSIPPLVTTRVVQARGGLSINGSEPRSLEQAVSELRELGQRSGATVVSVSVDDGTGGVQVAPVAEVQAKYVPVPVVLPGFPILQTVANRPVGAVAGAVVAGYLASKVSRSWLVVGVSALAGVFAGLWAEGYVRNNLEMRKVNRG